MREIFTKEYTEETKYRAFMGKIRPFLKFKNTDELFEDKTKNLSDEKFNSDFHINVGSIN
jgi:hypothetical protein